MGQRFELKINHHIPVNIQEGNLNNLHDCVNISRLAIAKHLFIAINVPSAINQDVCTEEGTFRFPL